MDYKFALVIAFLGIVHISYVNGIAAPPPGGSPCPYQTKYACDDQLDTDSVCLVIFNGSNPNNGTVDPKCVNSTYSSTALQCAYTCAACCQTPMYNCQNAPSPNPFNCAELTKAQCDQAAAKPLLAQYCPATCGLCQEGNCADTIDCSALTGACFDPTLTQFMTTYCARTCGFCASSTYSPYIPGGGGTCVDIATNCAENRNLCTNPVYQTLMNQQCPATCGTCTIGTGTGVGGSVSCADSNANCAAWSANGFCTGTYYTQAQKQQYCARTCNLCSTTG